eukprot:8932129-Prorocentrum_lima.AAC.1
MLLRPALSVLSSLCSVAFSSEPCMKFRAEQIQEMRLCRDFLFLSGVNLAARWSNMVYCSDASMQ